MEIDNQNDIRFRGVTAFNPFGIYTSSSRGQMQSSAISQHYVISGSEPNSIQTGADLEYGKYTNSIVTPHNIKIIAIVDRYIPSPYNGIQFNPQRIVIYQTFDNEGNRPLYGMIDLSRISNNHPKFGYEYKPTTEAQQIRVGNTIPKDTVLYDTPAKDSLGNYSTGKELNTLYSSLEGTIEDSILVAKDVIAQMKTKIFTTRQLELGEKEFPLNLYGDDKEYKVMPDIGEYCIPTGNAYPGIIMAKREFHPELLPITFTKKTTRNFDSITDIPLDGNGQESRVIDIIVYKQAKTSAALSPHVLAQLNKYADAYKDFCERILREYRTIQNQNQYQALFTDEFDQLIRHCMAIMEEPLADEKGKNVAIQKVSNFNRKLDDYTIIITTEYVKEIGPGFKLSDYHGGKGVVAAVIPVDPSEMPYDPITGERADIVISPETTWNRMNPGRSYEQTLKASLVELRKWLMNTCQVDKDTPNLKDRIMKLDDKIKDQCFKYIERFLDIVTDIHYRTYCAMSFQEKTLDLYHVIKDRFFIYLPHNNPRNMLDVFMKLKEEKYLSDPNRLRYWNPYTQREEETLVPQRIGPVYYICLEKIGDDAAAVSTAATQPNGIIVPLTSKDKSTQQVRKQATRFPGESENRLLVGVGPRGLAAEIQDRSNNPVTVEAMMDAIYSTDKPTNIDTLVDRSKYPLGMNRPLQILRHFIQCNGVKLEYRIFNPDEQARSEINPITGMIAMTIEEDDEDEKPKRKRRVSPKVIVEAEENDEDVIEAIEADEEFDGDD